LGPTLGGWLTENYNWRWVFYINMPIGILAFIGILVFMTETKVERDRPFDMFGFAFLSLAVGALQMALDRGEQKDWFGSTEIIIETGLAAIGFWVFLVHSLTARQRPFLNLGLFSDRNFVVGIAFIFVTTAVMYSTLALLPPMLTLLGYPVLTTGMLMVPRSITTMVFMILAGRLLGRIDIRALLFVGFAVTSLSLWQMTGYSPEMDEWPIILAGLTQGVGLAFIYVPLSTLAFSTLSQELRNEGTALFSLIRNIGGSIGIAVIEMMLDRNIQISHSELVQNITRYNPAFHDPMMRQHWSLDSVAGLARLDQMVNFQAAIIGYINNFKLLMIFCLAALPLLLLVRSTRSKAAEMTGPALE
ncbi:MAG: DHA2 family efflux MFS transporter permease subunit, partial [Alphaproteobacteria bacterium]|nr:DHA2 family efflux MFS transporter permease subunit [Alphaproteobacteria bacterium]